MEKFPGTRCKPCIHNIIRHRISKYPNNIPPVNFSLKRAKVMEMFPDEENADKILF